MLSRRISTISKFRIFINRDSAYRREYYPFSMPIGKTSESRVVCAMWLHILIRNWAKLNAQHVNQTIIRNARLRRRLLRDKRPCGMPFNSRTDIRRPDQGPMEIFDETLWKKEQVPLPSSAIERRYFVKRKCGNNFQQWQISSAS